MPMQPDADSRPTPGRPPLDVEELQRRGTYRNDRHGDEPAGRVMGTAMTAAARQRVLKGLPAPAKAIVELVLDEYDGDWDRLGLIVLRAFASSVARLEQLQAS